MIQHEIGLICTQFRLFRVCINSIDMESLISQRIRAIAERYNFSITALSKRIGVAQQTLNRQIIGENAMSYYTIEAILSCFPEVSAEWLLRGEGEMLKGKQTPSGNAETKSEISFYVDENGFLKLKQ